MASTVLQPSGKGSGTRSQLPGIAEKVVQAMKMEVEENGVKLSIP